MRTAPKIPTTSAAFILAVAVSAPTAAAAPAAGANGDLQYGAIALNFRDDVSAVARNFDRKTRAIQAALRACEVDSAHPAACHKIVWVRRGCAAVAVRYRANGTISRYGWGIGKRKRTAVNRAERFVGAGAVQHTWLCTKR